MCLPRRTASRRAGAPRSGDPDAALLGGGLVLLDKRPAVAVLVLTIGLFFTYTGGYAFWFWFPTMMQRLTGWTDVRYIGWVGAVLAGSMVIVIAMTASLLARDQLPDELSSWRPVS